jgi:hypothetical protein
MKSVVCQGKFTHRIYKVTKKASNSLDQEYLEHPPRHRPPAFSLPPWVVDSDRWPTILKDHWPKSIGLGKILPKEARVRTCFSRKSGRTVDWCDVARVTIDVLPDVALLQIFDFYMDEVWMGSWKILVHVCRKWRNIAFGSPRRLNLRLYCNVGTPVRDTLDVWPPLPIALCSRGHTQWGMDNIIAALEHNDRISHIDFMDFPPGFNLFEFPNANNFMNPHFFFPIPTSYTEIVLAAMERPFPALTRLCLAFGFDRSGVPVVPDSFLGGSAASLQHLWLDHVPFPGLPKLLLSATQLAILDLRNIPRSGSIPPDAMAPALSLLTSLECLIIEFQSPRSLIEFLPRRSYTDKESRRPPSLTRILPVLTQFRFAGDPGYLEVLVAWIDAPLLNKLEITFFLQLISDTPDLTQFITRSSRFKAHDRARVEISDSDVSVTLPQSPDGNLHLNIQCSPSNLQLSSLAKACSSFFPRPLILAVECLYILKFGFERLQLHWEDDIENGQWLEVLRPFTTVKSLYLSRRLAPHIVLDLQEIVGESVTEVLPALQNIFLEEPLRLGPVQEIIEQFVAARQLSGHPVAISYWEREKLTDEEEDESFDEMDEEMGGSSAYDSDR